MKLLNNRDIQKVQLEMLQEVHRFCEENELKYFLIYGTLIGAVRHNGFIPWDDDIDICMPRPDYEKFIRSFSSVDKNLRVVSHLLDENVPYFFAKVEDTSTVIETKASFDVKEGIFLDIFPIDGVPEDERLQKNYVRDYNFYRNIYNLKMITVDKERNLFKNLFLLGSRLVTSAISTSYLVKKLDAISKTYDYKSCKTVSVAASADIRLMLEKTMFATSVPLEFEGKHFNAPAGYHEFLQRNYGDYMKMPPKEKQVSHHKFKAYRK